MSQISESIFKYLCHQTPCFPVNASSIQIIHEPAVFYNTLLQKCASAQRRITMASLYLGTGQLEQQLVDTIRKKLAESKSTIKVKMLMDYCRSSRGTTNTRTMLKDLVEEHPEDCRVALYHTPKLRGLSRKYLPLRYNELIGLQHMKVYIFDDTLILSGANLSNDYFTNRQDRYIMFENCPNVANYYEEVVSQVCAFSLQLEVDENKEERLTLSQSWPQDCHPYKAPRKSFVAKAHETIKNVMDSSLEKYSVTSSSDIKGADTWVFPLIQMGQLNITQDSTILPGLVSSLGQGAVMHIASGYFNMTDTLMNNLMTSKACFSILVAHPTSNGFLGAKGIAGQIPSVYTFYAREFLKKVGMSGRGDSVKLLEFVRPGWTYHAKGMWLSRDGDNKNPFFTYVGSSNLGLRSEKRDLEAQAIVMTHNEDLQRRLGEERDRLFEKGVEFPSRLPKDRGTTPFVMICSSIFRSFF